MSAADLKAKMDRQKAAASAPIPVSEAFVKPVDISPAAKPVELPAGVQQAQKRITMNVPEETVYERYRRVAFERKTTMTALMVAVLEAADLE